MGYRFLADGSADSFTSRVAITLWALIPQVVLTLIAAGITLGIIRLVGREENFQKAAIKLETILLFIGNLVALPQIILCFTMLDIFSYNSYQVHWIPLRILILVVMCGGALIPSIYFLRSLLRVWKANKE